MVIIGRGTWIDQLASKIIEREKNLGRNLKLLRVESGLGASGIPHVGSLGDAVRAHGIRLALKDSGYRSELIAFSDDLDGLRKVPAGFPDWLEDHIAKPVSDIPDPFDCHTSYGAHMSSVLTDALDRCEIPYTFKSGTETYREGTLIEQIDRILEHSKEIGQQIALMSGQKKYEDVLPYFPICEGCGRLYVAEAYEYKSEERKVLYRCKGTKIQDRNLRGCNYEGEISIADGRGKLSWKAEFAARWSALDIRFEAYGKDIADSVRINDWIADNILDHPHPSHAKYEMFLDKSGKKISKSKGNVFTPQTWLRYGTKESLLLLMFKRIAGTRAISPVDIPVYMDEYDKLENVYFGRLKGEKSDEMKLVKLRGLYEYINSLDPPKAPNAHVPYQMLVQLTSYAPQDSIVEYVEKKLLAYNTISEPNESLKNKIMLASNWGKDYTALVSSNKVKVSSEGIRALTALATFLPGQSDPNAIQTEIFEIARRNDLLPKEFFSLLYLMLLGVERGPRLGPYLIDIGIQNAVKIIRKQLDKA